MHQPRAQQQPELVDLIIAALKQQWPELEAIYLFGSWGSIDQHADSDLDVAVLLPVGQTLGFEAWSSTRFELQKLVGCPVDLVNLREASTVFQKEVTWKGQRVLNANTYQVAVFESLVMSLYQKLNEERHEILAQIQQTGRVLAL
jgi:predicted nucleotidyltransferase